MRILITGGAGFIGRHLARHLKERHQVTAFDLREQELKGILHIKGDVRDAELVRAVCQGHDAIIHLAAQVSAPASIEEPEETMAINTGGSGNVLDGARRGGVKKVLLASSAAVYGDSPETPTPESHALAPLTPYAESKATMEALAAESAVATCCLRLFNVYGPGQDPRGPYAAAIPAFIDRALKNEPLTIHGDGLQTRDFIAVTDVCRAFELALERGDGAINIASGTGVTINRLAEMVKKLSGSGSRILHGAARPGDPRESLADVTKAKELLGFAAQVSLEEGLAEMIAARR